MTYIIAQDLTTRAIENKYRKKKQTTTTENKNTMTE